MPIIGCFPQGGGEPEATSGGKRICRYVVGSSTAGWTAAECDYLCDGTADEVEINAALAALPAGGGEVHLLDGTYHLAGSVNVPGGAVKLTGCGKSTLLQAMQGSDVATNLFELSCTSFHLAEMAVHITYEQSAMVLISNGVCFINGTAAVKEIKMTGCEVDNIIKYYVKGPNSARFVMENCRSLSSDQLNYNPGAYCDSTFSNSFFDHGISLPKKSIVANCSFNMLKNLSNPAIQAVAKVPCVITGNLIYAVHGIEGNGLGLITNNRIILKKGDSESNYRIGIMSYGNGDLIEGNMITRGSGSSNAFSTSEYTIIVVTDVTGTAVIGNMLYDKDVTDNGTGTVKANNAVLSALG